MSLNPEPIQPERWLNDVSTIKVFAHPLRLRMIELMQQPTTVKHMSEVLVMPAPKLYYHLNLLEKHTLIQVVDHNIEGNLIEKVYQVTAREFKLINPLVSGQVPDESASALFTAMLQATERDFRRAYNTRDATEGTPPRHPFLSKKAFKLNDAQLSDLHHKLDALIQEVTALAEQNAAGSEDLYELTLVFYQKNTQEAQND